MKIACAQINPTVGNLKGNCEKILRYVEEAKKKGAQMVVFPEMALTGYPPEDLLTLPSFIEAAEKELQTIIPQSRDITIICGTVRKNLKSGEKRLHNTAAICHDGKLLGYQDKTLLPDYDVFSERRYFEPGSANLVWNLFNKKIAITICEDVWQHAGEVTYSFYPKDPVIELKKEKPDLVINLSSSPYYLGRSLARINMGKATAKTLQCPFILCNQVGGNDSLLFDGYSYHLNQKGELVSVGKGFEEDLFITEAEAQNPISFQPTDTEDIFKALVMGIGDYFRKTGIRQASLGLSGGIDSAVVACIATAALGKENVLCVSMPSRYTSEASKKDARLLANHLGVAFKEISIEDPFSSFLHLLEPHFEGKQEDLTEENLQARLRGVLLMALSNKLGHMVLNTGNKSEMAMGYMTLYGDMCGGLGVLSDVTKYQVYTLAKWINRESHIIPNSIIEKVPSAELKPNQKDTDSLPEYGIVDKVLESYVEEHLAPQEIAQKYGIDLPLVLDLVKRIHLNEYKRRQAPPALRITKKAFTVGRRFPIAQKWNI